MTEENLEVLLVIGGGIAAIVVLMIIWFVWKNMRASGRALKMALDGVGHEFRFNLQRVLAELRDLSANGDVSDDLAMPLARPQLESLRTQPAVKDKRALERLDTMYQALEASRSSVRQQGQSGEAVDAYKRSAVEAVAILYLWEQHKGGLPEKAPSTSSSAVRDWMKSLGFTQTLIPGMALRDEVIRQLRGMRMPLKPGDLRMTAQDYYGTPAKENTAPQGELVAGAPDPVEPTNMAEEAAQQAAKPEVETLPVENEWSTPEPEEDVAEASQEAEPVVDNAVAEPTPAPLAGDAAQPSRRRRRRR